MRPAWRVAGTSVAGARNATRGGDCQDHHHLQVTSGGALIAVVSDGAGSAPCGGEGAALICQAVASRLDGFLALHEAGKCSLGMLAGACRSVVAGVQAARTKAEREAEARGLGLDAFHATMVGAAVLPGRGGIFFHIGDGAALALGQGGARWLLSPPANGEYADTTYFFTEAEWRRNLRFSPLDAGYDTIFLMSDGVTEVALAQNEGGPRPFMGFFEPIGRHLAATSRKKGEAALHATLDGPAVRARNDDDKTLVWASLADAA